MGAILGRNNFNYTLRGVTPPRAILGEQRETPRQIPSLWFHVHRGVRKSRVGKGEGKLRGRRETNGQRITKGEVPRAGGEVAGADREGREVEWREENVQVKVSEVWPVLSARGSVNTGARHATTLSAR